VSAGRSHVTIRNLVAASGLLADHGAAQRLELAFLHGLRDDHVWLRYHIRANR
jgi:hypothetical protein